MWYSNPSLIVSHPFFQMLDLPVREVLEVGLSHVFGFEFQMRQNWKKIWQGTLLRLTPAPRSFLDKGQPRGIPSAVGVASISRFQLFLPFPPRILIREQDCSEDDVVPTANEFSPEGILFSIRFASSIL